MERWRPILGFPGYSVSDLGFVRNDQTDHLLIVRTNQNNQTYVGLMFENKQFNRRVAKLVASTFMDPHPNENFTSVIHLDGDLSNNALFNLMWRPRGFATMYHRQFGHGVIRDRPVRNRRTGVIYENAFQAATTYGLLAEGIYYDATNYTLLKMDEPHWPEDIRFELVYP